MLFAAFAGNRKEERERLVAIPLLRCIIKKAPIGRNCNILACESKDRKATLYYCLIFAGTKPVSCTTGHQSFVVLVSPQVYLLQGPRTLLGKPRNGYTSQQQTCDFAKPIKNQHSLGTTNDVPSFTLHPASFWHHSASLMLYQHPSVFDIKGYATTVNTLETSRRRLLHIANGSGKSTKLLSVGYSSCAR